MLAGGAPLCMEKATKDEGRRSESCVVRIPCHQIVVVGGVQMVLQGRANLAA